MPHAKEHPLAGYHVVPDPMTGEVLKIVDWLDRLPGVSFLLRPHHPIGRGFRDRLATYGLHESGAVLAHAPAGLTLVHHAELPSYDPVPIGVIS
ncbi:hypothetical protein [Methylobacterium sp. J-070]|uniref:hypothetical protein n=1 Tax=Methylobacterium sp. J-070 TaxID=2836650 RepID=UPI001FB9379F|nr:hypothetical protein [Methylobacterium sp. J-070]MCJ2051678.1 hypothetical protein [Methylobacterium sp. J-070]